MPELNDAAGVIARALLDAKKIAVFTGAGISTSCGIPDFRGEKGLYATVKDRYNLPYPEAIFEISYFSQRPEPFFDFSRELFTTEIHPSETHRFLAWLEEKGKPVSIVTQNIDMLHERAGSRNVIPCHGTYSTGSCLSCNREFRIDEYIHNLADGQVPYCDCGGVIKPDVVFFGEQLPAAFFNIYQDPPAADVLLVLGSSLMVQPAAQYPLRLMQRDPGVFSVIVNNTPTTFDSYFTLIVREDLDDLFREVLREMQNTGF